MDPHIAERIFVLYWKTAGRHSGPGKGAGQGPHGPDRGAKGQA